MFKKVATRILRLTGLTELIDSRIATQVEPYTRGLPPHLWQDTTVLHRLNMRHGVLRSTADMNAADKFDANQFYQYSDKATCAFAAASIWRGGDYMEFGSTDLNTFRNFLTAYDVFDLEARFPNTRFYGFDIFGKVVSQDPSVETKIAAHEHYKDYMDTFSARGDVLPSDLATLHAHNLYVDKCELVQGYFEETLTRERAKAYLEEGREIGFACLDCNIDPPYKLVFEFIIDLMAPESYIYMDEYYSGAVARYFDEFVAELKTRRGMDARLIRNAGGFGALFYLFEMADKIPALEFGPPLRKPHGGLT